MTGTLMVGSSHHLQPGPGKWKSSSMQLWEKMHKQLWQGADVPTVLAATALKKSEGTSEDQGFFVESTLPTSLLLSAICAQISQGRSAAQFRYGASKVLFELLRKLVRSSYLKVQFESEGNSFSVPIPTNGLFPSAILLSMVGADVVQKTRELWNAAVQDKVCLTNRQT